MRRPITTIAAAAATFVASQPSPTVAAPQRLAERDAAHGVVADFEGRRLDLGKGWGEARACHVDDDGTSCYLTEADMVRAEGLFARGGSLAAAMSTCSSDLRLYRDANWAGPVLSVSTRQVVVNLVGYGFNDVTSSFKVGACDARLYDTTTGSGLYPGDTSANTTSGSMSSGWNDRVGSLYIL